MENRRLTRSNNGMIAGVCGGIANYFDWDPTLVRIGYILKYIHCVRGFSYVYYLLDCNA